MGAKTTEIIYGISYSRSSLNFAESFGLYSYNITPILSEAQMKLMIFSETAHHTHKLVHNIK
jgi:hypothetical protein